MDIIDKLVAEFGGERWHWEHAANCSDCWFNGEYGGIDWCWRVTGRRSGPETYEQYLDLAYKINANWQWNKLFRDLYSPTIRNQLRNEIVVLRSIEGR